MTYAEARQELNELAALIGENTPISPPVAIKPEGGMLAGVENKTAQNESQRVWAGGQAIPPFVKQPGDVIQTCKLTDAEKLEKLDKAKEWLHG